MVARSGGKRGSVVLRHAVGAQRALRPEYLDASRFCAVEARGRGVGVGSAVLCKWRFRGIQRRYAAPRCGGVAHALNTNVGFVCV